MSYIPAYDKDSDAFTDCGNILLLAIKNQHHEFLSYVLSDQFIEFWRYDHIELALKYWLIQPIPSHTNTLIIILSTDVCRHIFLGLSNKEQFDLLNPLIPYVNTV